ncbi:short-chain dehydrogenase/reductase SDR [Desarmillaria tabescens]|uniref:Short-chain dehydrogenase/reductase SDR n=1 Tax=Armillaria tabescens TaxID=1929756 RepID=A0AA39TQ24_ARMTA|nr:short-chain dehydrogenase/reductase SDR [Desarmillaria tabescens]KAK0462508.1 short-chain dehydrogenase/reductase SDR [Desarmillaria tabescens]
MSLTGKVAIVTGSSSGIGLATTQALLRDGCSVLGVDLLPNDIFTNSPAFSFFEGNIADPLVPAAIIAASKEAFPQSSGVDILVNNAGIMDNNAGVDALKDEVWERVIAVNLTGPVKLMREAVKVMKVKGGGVIVNVTSKAGMSGATAGVAYTASKHGIVGATKNTAWLYKEDGIRCNAVAPGGVATNIANTMRDLDITSSMRIKPVVDVHVNPVTGEGIAAPETIAQVIVFLASDSSKGINGAILPVDNAWSTI